jgi:hypothetical protein
MPTVTGQAYWAHVHKPNETYDPRWSIDLFVSEADHQALLDQGLTPKRVKLNKKGNITHPGHEEGDEFFQFKKNVAQRSGTPNTPPRVVDASKNRIPPEILIWNGSMVTVGYRTYPWTFAGNSGVSSELLGVQVLELAEGPEEEVDFEEVEGYVAPEPVADNEEDDPFNE